MVVQHGVDLAALVSHHHSGGDASGTHQYRERRRVVLAEAAAGLEQELINRISAERRRIKGVVKLLLAKYVEDLADVGPVAADRCAQLPRKVDAAWIVVVRQTQVVPERRGADFRVQTKIGV